jgi:hypothetical protein
VHAALCAACRRLGVGGARRVRGVHGGPAPHTAPAVLPRGPVRGLRCRADAARGRLPHMLCGGGAVRGGSFRHQLRARLTVMSWTTACLPLTTGSEPQLASLALRAACIPSCRPFRSDGPAPTKGTKGAPLPGGEAGADDGGRYPSSLSLLMYVFENLAFLYHPLNCHKLQ